MSGARVIGEDFSESMSAIWKKLSRIRQVRFSSWDGNSAETNREGSGDVRIVLDAEGRIVTMEEGKWRDGLGQTFRFRNSLRWTLHDADTIFIEHLRYGRTRPVTLAILAPASHNRLESRNSHLCGDDLYTPFVEIDQDALILQWTVFGPHKRYAIRNQYQ